MAHTLNTPPAKAERPNVVLKATIEIRMVANASNLAKFKLEIDRLAAQYFAHGLYRIETKTEEWEF